MIKNNKCHSNGTMRNMIFIVLLGFVGLCVFAAPAIAEEIIVVSDEDTTYITFPDGTVIRTYTFGGTVISTVVIGFPDGTQSTMSSLSDGTTVLDLSLRNCDQILIYVDPDGTVTVIDSDANTDTAQESS